MKTKREAKPATDTVKKLMAMFKRLPPSSQAKLAGIVLKKDA